MTNRMQKKCFIASAGIHLLLVVIVLIGPAFLASKDKPNEQAILDVIPAKLIDAAFNGGGTPAPKQLPAPRPPEPPPTQPVTPPREIKQHEPAPVKEAQTEKNEPESLELSKPNQHKVVINTTPTVRKKSATKSKPDTSEADNQRRIADARRQAADMIGKAARSLREGTAPSTAVELSEGTGGGEAYANYAQVVQSIYFHAWLVPDETSSDNAITKASVTIASDGQVVSYKVLRSSGDAGVDRSVERTLERVKFIAPFPEGAKDKQRTYTINFNLNAKRLLAG